MTNGIATLNPQLIAARPEGGAVAGQLTPGVAPGGNPFAALFQIALDGTSRLAPPVATAPPQLTGEPLSPVLPDGDAGDRDEDGPTTSAALAAALFVAPRLDTAPQVSGNGSGAAPGLLRSVPGAFVGTTNASEVPTPSKTVPQRLGAAGLEGVTADPAAPDTTPAAGGTPAGAPAPEASEGPVAAPGTEAGRAASETPPAPAALDSPFATSLFEDAARRGQTIQTSNLAAGLLNFSPDLLTSAALAGDLSGLSATAPPVNRGEFPAQPAPVVPAGPQIESADRGSVAPRGPAPTAAAPLSTTQFPVAPIPQATEPQVVAVPIPSVATAAAAAAVAVRGSPIIPAQAPLVTDLTPKTAPVPGDGEAVRAVQEVGGLRAASPATPISDAPSGDRPVMAGERLAALVGTASRLATPPAPPAPFAALLTDSGAGTAPPVTGAGAAERLAPTASVLFPPTDEPDRPAPTGLHPGGAAAPGPVEAAAPRAESAPVGHTPPAPAVQLAEAIAAHGRALEAEGKVEFRIRLDPPDLGPVKVHLVATGDEIRGQVVVADDAVRRMIESQLPELRQRLDAAGITVHRFDVAADAGGGGRNDAPWLPPAPEGTGPARPAPARRAGPTVRSAGGLDVMA
ncbi:: Flg_hook [Gemmataceae bacterium]|nr:: Flg_hook [Gemmataceae bacterium]VTT97917.1 : Flg_hook [Gemmataceae bacterium]